MKRYRKVIPCFLALTAMLLAGCGGDDATGPGLPTSIQSWIDLGWSQYSTGDYENAAVSFDNATDMAEDAYWDAYEDYEYAASLIPPDSIAMQEAMNQMNTNLGYLTNSLMGLGWVSIKYNQLSYAAFLFTTAIGITEYDITPDTLEITTEYTNALGGYSFLLQIVYEYQQSNEYIAQLLTADSTWAFEYEAGIDYLDLRLIRAENYYLLGNFSQSLQEALAINDIIQYQPGLTEEDFNLATYQGTQALLELIGALDNLI